MRSSATAESRSALRDMLPELAEQKWQAQAPRELEIPIELGCRARKRWIRRRGDQRRIHMPRPDEARAQSGREPFDPPPHERRIEAIVPAHIPEQDEVRQPIREIPERRRDEIVGQYAR